MADAKPTKTKKPAKKATHPKYSEMIAAAIESLKEKGGSSRMAILKFITSKYKVSDNPNLVNSQLKLALKKGVASGALTQVKGTGASGSFKLAKKTATAKPKKTAAKKKVTTTMPKSPKKVKAKKPAAKKANAKSPKKVVKPKPKKSPAKKPAKKAAKPKAKKPAAKPAKNVYIESFETKLV